MYIKGSLHTYREYNYNTVAPQLVHFHIRGRNRTKMNMRTTEIWRSSYCYVIVCTISSSSGVANHWTTERELLLQVVIDSSMTCSEHCLEEALAFFCMQLTTAGPPTLYPLICVASK
ncbi:uncharacterized protein ACN427_004646 isoform 3-T6 [Glossina fuscipes fuscipes]